MKKNIVLIAISVLIIQSCKENKNTTTKNSTEGKNNEKVESVKLNDKGIAIAESTDSTKILSLPTALYETTDGKYKYKFNLEKGKSYPFNSRNIETNTAKRGNESISQKYEILDKMSFTVLDEKPDKYILTVTYIATKNTITAQGKNTTIDSDGPEPKDNAMKKDWKMRKALMNNSFTMELYKTGKVGLISGMEKIYPKIENDLKGMYSSDELKNIMEAVKKQIINPTTFKEQFSSTMIKFPKEGVAIGGTWKEKGIKAYTTFKLEKIENDFAVITISASLPTDTRSDEKQGIKMTATKKGTISGKLYINKKTGWIDKGENTRTITIIMTQNFQGKTMSQTQSSVSKTYINQ